MEDTMEEKINTRLRELHITIKVGSDSKTYTAQVHKAAARVHEDILEACSAGFEVTAYKDNGRMG
jgi:hypothetical protein